MRTIYRSDRGKVRQHNEDNGGIFINTEGVHLAIVADGMGGHRAGDVASMMTIDMLKESWKQSSQIETANDADEWLRSHITKVNEALFKHAEENSECQGMGTTIVAVICTEKFATIANIGDSRCYLFNESGFKQVTEDHSLVNELVRTGQITKEDAENHPRKNVLLRALGTETKVDIDISTVIFEEDDVILLCSDGLSNKLSDQEMIEIIKNEQPFEEKADSFIELANHNGGEDNITLVLIQYNIESAGR